MNNSDFFLKKASLHFLSGQVPKWVLEINIIKANKKKISLPVRKKQINANPQDNYKLQDLKQIRRKSEFSQTFGIQTQKYVWLNFFNNQMRIASLFPEQIICQHLQDDNFTVNRRKGLLGRMKTVLMKHTKQQKNSQTSEQKNINLRRNGKCRLSMPLTPEITDIVQETELKTRRQTKYGWQISDNQGHTNQQLLIKDQQKVQEEKSDEEDNSGSSFQVETQEKLVEIISDFKKPLLFNIMKDKMKQSSKTISQYCIRRNPQKETTQSISSYKLPKLKIPEKGDKNRLLTERSSQKLTHHSAYSLTCESIKQELRKKQFLIRSKHVKYYLKKNKKLSLKHPLKNACSKNLFNRTNKQRNLQFCFNGQRVNCDQSKL